MREAQRLAGPRAVLIALLLLPALLLSSCSGSGDDGADGGGAGDEQVLRVLAGSEIKDLAPVLEKARDATGVRVELTYTGTLEGAEQVASGGAESSADAIWFSSNRYLNLLPGGKGAVATSTRTMTSPVVLGVRESKAKELGWDASAPTWGQIADAAKAKKFRFGMTDPSASNSGFSALVGVATALSGGGSALDSSKVASARPGLRAFFGGQTLTSGSSGWLAEAYVKAQGRTGADAVDGLVNYESVLLELNDGGQLSEPLTIVRPKDGVVTADYPFALLKSAAPEKRAAYDELAAWLRTPEAQQLIMETTSRRPAVPSVKLDPKFGKGVLLELPFPASRQVADGLIESYLQDLRRPTQTVYVLDVSGSMEGPRLDQLKSALGALTGQGSQQGSDRFTTFRDRERVVLLPFAGFPMEPQEYLIAPGAKGDDARRRIRDSGNALSARGGTAIFASTEKAYDIAAGLKRRNPDTFTSIVVMTDGENTQGIGLAEFRRRYDSWPAEQRAIPVFAVRFGDADPAELKGLTEATGGKVFDAGSGDLTAAFREIRGYQ